MDDERSDGDNEYEAGSHRRATVLIVDDEPINIRVVTNALCNQYDLRFALDGETALEIAAKQLIDLVLLDVVMPGMDGYEVCQRLKENAHTSSIPVIFLTARGGVNDVTRGFALGGFDYITKPIDPQIVCARVKAQLERKQEHDLLLKESMTDDRTKILNPRYFARYLQRELASMARAQRSITLMMIDVDFFKQYNDTLGHLQGNMCLFSIARTLEKTFFRPDDIVARWGGDEFAVVLRETGLEGSCVLVERIHSSVHRLSLSHPGSPISAQVTVSVGAVSLVPQAGLEPSNVVEAADRMLIEAKQKGRMRGVCADLDSEEKRAVLPPTDPGPPG